MQNDIARVYLYMSKSNADWIKKSSKKKRVTQSAFIDALTTFIRKARLDIEVVSKQR